MTLHYPEYEPFYSSAFEAKRFLISEDNFSKTAHIQSVPIFEQHNCQSPLITIAIPTYKRTDTLIEALESALNQKGVNQGANNVGGGGHRDYCC
ncbi:hypothetical protein BKH46_04795 [Helicobacter sp. 12S02634-8]|uniref:glycosyltransferase n=1 Tax=Helicobacter sp. 12S02634-8 TaxID=1476199 RepID=UPI000BA53F8C|nr:glycosyltransferase [Helicobacter sp. 12S02634-8]PAF47042.1 hypothetical protein BKH46_04795 [Helicobacter sp. 12S02634-8]